MALVTAGPSTLRTTTLRARLDALDAPAPASPLDEEAQCRRRAIEDVCVALRLSETSIRAWSRATLKDLASVQDWLADGRKRLPLWTIQKLPPTAQAFVLERMADRLPREVRRQLIDRLLHSLEAEAGTGTNG